MAAVTNQTTLLEVQKVSIDENGVITALDSYEQLPCPSGWTWGEQDISREGAGRTEDALMHKMMVKGGRKATIALTWENRPQSEIGFILNKISGDDTEYFRVKTLNPKSVGENDRIKEGVYYVGDRSAPLRYFWDHGRNVLYQSLTFEFIER